MKADAKLKGTPGKAPGGTPWKELVADRRRRGVCPYCGEPPAPSKKQCQYHLDMMAANRKRLRDERAAAGLCSAGCGRKASRGRRECTGCAAKNLAAFRRWRASKKDGPGSPARANP